MSTEQSHAIEDAMGKIQKKIDVLKWKVTANEDRKETLIRKIESATERHKRVKVRLERRLASKSEYEKTIKATDSAYQKILISSTTLLEVLKQNVGDDPDDIPEITSINPQAGNGVKGVNLKETTKVRQLTAE